MNSSSPTIPGWKSNAILKSSYKGYQYYGDLSSNYCATEKDKDTITGHVFSRSSSPGLLQNCDLPPPLKVFLGANRDVLTSTPSLIHPSKIGRDEEYDKCCITPDFNKEDKLGVLKALQLSQTRAREAERKLALITQERDRLSAAFLNESMRLLAHRQWIKLLELEISQLQSCEKELYKGSSSEEEKHSSENMGNGNLTVCMVLALCLGIAGVGFAFGCTYMFQGSFSVSAKG
ncbi:hypothetical protein GIB67_042984 [Kingdonia uniflora]|uniref:Uncharacterized protein n=1 Tax=Kingdonia uniflora TaxID=39325 RepID=A0A7J7NTI9_9MAGN|nr:hypothetical protein GIB67_042984 [Kingdonia uniflora]